MALCDQPRLDQLGTLPGNLTPNGRFATPQSQLATLLDEPFYGRSVIERDQAFVGVGFDASLGKQSTGSS